MAEVLERAGCEIDFRPDQTCCGQPAFNSGYPEEARRVADHFARVFDGAEYVVVSSGSCTSMLLHHGGAGSRAGEVAAMPPSRLSVYGAEAGNAAGSPARPPAPRIFEFSTFLTDVLKIDDVGASLDRVVTYHDSCHALRELKIKDAPRRLLSKVRGLRLAEMDAAEECCGFGGTFSVKFPDVSGAMARTKIESIERTGADTVVSIDSSCLMQLQGVLSRAGSKIRTMHLAEVLASR